MRGKIFLIDRVLDDILQAATRVGKLLGLKREVEPDVTTFIVGKAIAEAADSGGLQEVGAWSKGTPAAVGDGKVSLVLDGERVNCFLAQNGGELQEMAFETIRYQTDFQARNCGLVDPSVLAAKRVLIVGNSSVGGKIAPDLTRAGVKKFTLVDPDCVSIQNICRCEFDLFDLGLPKPIACRKRMRAINPRVEVNVYMEDIRKMDPDVLEEAIQRTDLAIWATDNPEAQRVGNSLTYHRIPALFPGVYPQGAGGEIIITIPDETPCQECVLKGLSSQPVQRKGSWDYSTEGQLKPEPALIADIQNIVVHTTKLALALLSRGEEKSRLKDFIDPNLSVLFIGNEKDWIFEYPFQTAWGSAEVNPDCWCRGMR
jgi:molybdopterin/thiamine biosynthesis adenylyltransferase